MSLAVLVLIAFAILFLWVKTGQAIRMTAEIGKPVPYEHSIYVEGTGEVSAKPDVATISFTVETRGDDQGSAQMANSEKMNALMAGMRALGIEDKDIKTTYYNVYQESIWNAQTETYDLGEWITSSSAEVRVRDTSSVPQVLVKAGEGGATNISGPNFSIDDPSVYRAEARELAIKDAMEKAKTLSQKLGVKIDSVIGYSEYTPYEEPYPYPYAGDMMARSEAMALPEVAEGTTDVSLTVSVTFKLAD